MASSVVKPNKQSPAFGSVLVVGAGLIAIAVSLYATEALGSLWALILVGWGLQRVVASSRTENGAPTVVGLTIAGGYLLLAGVVAWFQVSEVLWALILVNWFGDAFTPESKEESTDD